MALQLAAPAKLNLSLEILGKRPDGYHELRSLMVRLPALADRITLKKARTFSFTCDDPSLPLGETNLIVKAVRAFEAATATTCTLHIHLEKRVPHGAGLGGGSSDAASVLLGLNQLHSAPLTEQELTHRAGTFGSDIPFFITPGPSWCTGRGEKIEPAENIPPLPVLLLKPSFGVSTQDAYGRFAYGRPLPDIPYATQKAGNLTLVNDLERPVFAKHRFLAEIKHWLLHQPAVSAALMSGSGSTVFAILRNLGDAPAIATAARRELDPSLWSWSGLSE